MGSRLLVVSAHTADFVWRSAGVIAKYRAKGKEVHIVVLSFGERGESAAVWLRGIDSIEEVKNIRREEAECAVKALGNPSIEFLDWGDHPLIINEARILKLVEILRKFRPDIVITHGPDDPLRPDHIAAANATLTATRLSTLVGLKSEYPPITEPRVYGFDPHIADQAGFYPHIYINISDVYDMKMQAMRCMETQKSEIEYYMLRDQLRGMQTRKFGTTVYYKYAEAFYMYTPIVAEDFP